MTGPSISLTACCFATPRGGCPACGYHAARTYTYDPTKPEDREELERLAPDELRRWDARHGSDDGDDIMDTMWWRES